MSTGKLFMLRVSDGQRNGIMLQEEETENRSNFIKAKVSTSRGWLLICQSVIWTTCYENILILRVNVHNEIQVTLVW